MEQTQFNQVALSTTVMNRLDMLKKTLPNWLKFDFQKIYILNWNSADGGELHEYVSSLMDSRVVVEDASGKRTAYFVASISRNIAAERCLEIAKPRWLFQIDSDILLNEEFNYLPLTDESIWMSHHTRMIIHPAFNNNESVFNKNSTRIEVTSAARMRYGTFGSVLMPSKKVFRYGHYNENLIENNLFDVLYLAQYYRNDYENVWHFRNELQHIEHSNEARMKNGIENDLVRAVEINKALSTLKPYRYEYEVTENGTITIN